MSKEISRTKGSQSVVSTSSTNKKAPLGFRWSRFLPKKKSDGKFHPAWKTKRCKFLPRCPFLRRTSVNLTAPRGEGCPRVKGCSWGGGWAADS
ncbi:hypothetical protein CEXT_23521 [Caerostris extrusa]|uniref:Uncharacterized protein n=1 Tax=Caerostris extrusa TaxID=172846 RepID=A0AAV4P8L9_CAEEX|nr:hypothetical protein CEXT_23521 [Caerostris extrusa]